MGEDNGARRVLVVARTGFFGNTAVESLAGLGFDAELVSSFAEAAARTAPRAATLVFSDAVERDATPPGAPGVPALVLSVRDVSARRMQRLKSLGYAGLVLFPHGLPAIPQVLAEPSLRDHGLTAEFAALPPREPPASLDALRDGGPGAHAALLRHLDDKLQDGDALSETEAALVSVLQTDSRMHEYDGFEKLFASAAGNIAALVKDLRTVGAERHAALLEEAFALTGDVHPDADFEHWQARAEALNAIGERWQAAAEELRTALLAHARARLAPG